MQGDVGGLPCAAPAADVERNGCEERGRRMCPLHAVWARNNLSGMVQESENNRLVWPQGSAVFGKWNAFVWRADAASRIRFQAFVERGSAEQGCLLARRRCTCGVLGSQMTVVRKPNRCCQKVGMNGSQELNAGLSG